MLAKSDESPSLPIQDIKDNSKRPGQTGRKMDGRENRIPLKNSLVGGINTGYFSSGSCFYHLANCMPSVCL